MIGVIGLGLIGGSLAKALNQNTDHTVYGYDLNETVCHKAKLLNAIEDVLTDEMLPQCDILIVALYPKATVDYIKANASKIKKGAIVIDCSGVKGFPCNEIEPIAKENGFFFVGGHPMAGMEHSGFNYAKRALFNNASMVIVPSAGTSIEIVEKVKKLCLSIGFSNIKISDAETHDKVIAFTSQLAHVVSSSYIKSPTAYKHQGFSAGSYKDLSRVAKLNSKMWTELFLENKSNLVDEIDEVIAHLNEYRQALDTCNANKLYELLEEGTKCKIEIDKEQF